MKVLCSTQTAFGTVMGQTMRVVAIAKALQRRGHDVQFLAGGKLVAVLKDYGLAVIELPEMPQLQYPYDNDPLKNNSKKEALIAEWKTVMLRLTDMEIAAAKREKPDLMLCGTMTGGQAAFQLQIPSVMVMLQPHGPKTIALFSERLVERDDMKEQAICAMSHARLILLEGIPALDGGVDLIEKPALARFRDKARFTGPLLMEEPDRLPERAELKTRHTGDREKPMIYVTIGGGSQLIGEKFLNTVLDMFRRLPEVKGVISTGLSIGPDEITRYNPPPYVSVQGFVPGTEMIKASDVTVFHGGSSTLMTCLACGTPAVVVPSMGEQEDNGAVLAQNGAGLVLDKQTLTSTGLHEAVHTILTDPSYRRNAVKLKAACQQYGGAEGAAVMLEQAVAREPVTV